MFDSLQNNQPQKRNGRSKNNLRPLVLILGFFAMASLGIIAFALLQKWNYPASAAPGIYKVLNYQGKLEDSGGVTVADGAHNIKFTIYDAAAAGNVLWTARESDACGAAFNPSAKSVTTSLGVFSTQLGESGDCPLNLDFNTDSYYLGITIGADSEMTPRKRIGAAGYAFNSDLLDGLSTSAVGGASAFVPITDASGNFVLTGNVTFDTNTFALDSTNDNIGIGTAAPTATRTLDLTTTKKYGVYSVTSYGGNDATGVYGETSSTANIRQYGVYGTSAGPTGHGVHGAATGTGNPFFANYGGYFTSAGDGGYGVYGEASASGAVSNIGGYFLAQGDTGYAVRGLAMGMGGVNYGGYFRANGPGGYGVYGYAADATAVVNYGGYFTAAGTGAGTSAVYGTATDTGAVLNFGGYFTAAGDSGQAVYGAATDTGAVQNYGGYFTAGGAAGYGVYGQASGSGTTYGVYGFASDTGAVQNYGGFFQADGQSGRAVYGLAGDGGVASVNFGGYFIADGGGAGTSGVSATATGAGTVYGVRGDATGLGAVTNYGGYFTASGDTGKGVYSEVAAAGSVMAVQGYASSLTAGITSYGGHFASQGGTGRGVFGDATNSGAEINYGGYFTARGTGAGTSGVYAEASGAAAVYGIRGVASDATAVANYGGYFTAGGTGGSRGVYGTSSGATGTNYGVYGDVTSAAGWGGYFTGGNGLYASRFSIADTTSAIAYNTIGAPAASHTAAGEIENASDLFIADDLEVDGASWFDGGHTDLAEMILYDGEGTSGDVVVVDPNNDNSAKIATKPYDQSVLGIISTKPSLIITGDIEEGKLLAVVGRVPTKVTNINGAIHRGDLLTTSSLPGHAMKAAAPGPIVGKALGECDQQECVIWVFLNVSWYGGF